MTFSVGDKVQVWLPNARGIDRFRHGRIGEITKTYGDAESHFQSTYEVLISSTRLMFDDDELRKVEEPNVATCCNSQSEFQTLKAKVLAVAVREARSRGWCAEIGEILEEMGLEWPAREFDVTVRVKIADLFCDSGDNGVPSSSKFLSIIGNPQESESCSVTDIKEVTNVAVKTSDTDTEDEDEDEDEDEEPDF